MNTLETHVESILGNEEETCAKLIVDDLTLPFSFANVVQAEKQYTFSFWLRSDASGGINTCGENISSTVEWTKHEITFVADSDILSIMFTAAGVYYIYHPQVETGTKATDWSISLLDLATLDDLDSVYGTINGLGETISKIIIDTDGIRSTVSNVSSTLDDVSGKLETTAGQISDLQHTAGDFTLAIKTIKDDGVSKVTTTTGVFDERGLTVDKSDASTKTTVTPDGMYVILKGVDENPDDETVPMDEVMLSATDTGVNARNLSADTYLIVGNRSRFENYGADRTGCFWIGG